MFSILFEKLNLSIGNLVNRKMTQVEPFYALDTSWLLKILSERDRERAQYKAKQNFLGFSPYFYAAQ